MNIGIIGLGYVGLITAVGLAEFNNEVFCYDVNSEKISKLRNKETPIFEEGLAEKLNNETIMAKIHILDSLSELIIKTDMFFVAVGTPSKLDGSADTSAIDETINNITDILIKNNICENKILVIKSTIPVGFSDSVQGIINKKLANTNSNIEVCFVPEFLREGTALKDFFNPERIVVGASSDNSLKLIKELFYPFLKKGIPLIETNCVSAEIIKYASNIMLATKITLLNEIADYADYFGGKIADISYAVGLDSRIGSKFLSASIGFGGGCFPKDVRAFTYFTMENGFNFPVVQSILKSNDDHINRYADKIVEVAKKHKIDKILILGTAFKANTDDVRESPALKIIKTLLYNNIKVVVSDPKAMENTRKILIQSVEYSDSIFDGLNGVEMAVVCTEWNEYKEFDFEPYFGNLKVVFDLRNILNREKFESGGVLYYGIAN